MLLDLSASNVGRTTLAVQRARHLKVKICTIELHYLNIIQKTCWN